MTEMIFARPNGEWASFSGLLMAGRSGNRILQPEDDELIPLPEGAALAMVTEHMPFGIDPDNLLPEPLEFNPYKKKNERIYAVAALLPQGFTRTLLPAAKLSGRELPLLGYTAVGIRNGQPVVAAVATDEHRKWHPQKYNTPKLAELTDKLIARFPKNRLVLQLAKCSLEYSCFTAQNLFYRRYEAGIPVSPTCNANCLGCISLSSSECCPSPQERIGFVPSPQEIAELAVYHLQQAPEGIISFGQGCEGEPSLQAETIAKAVRIIRSQTDRGIININTNAGDHQKISLLLKSGIDSLRVSLFSPVKEEYAAYHRPQGFSLDDVERSLLLAYEAGTFCSLNLLTYPGFSDERKRVERLVELIKKTGVAQVQLRNLNIDPASMEQFCNQTGTLGIRGLISHLKKACPTLLLGSYSRSSL